MKLKCFTLIFLVGSLFAASSVQAESQKPAMIGILLDTAPLPELLTKHLGLSPDQGIRIQNVRTDSPADKAGLERDDIIIGYNGQKATDNEDFVNAVRSTEAGTEISLEIIHLGQRKTVKLKPEILEGQAAWKYPPEPEIVQMWRPGKMFRLDPDEENWLEITPDHFPNIDIYKLFNENYTYQYSEDGEKYTITIKGNPDDKDSEIIVRSGDNEYTTTIGQIEKLPEKYQESAKISVENARKTDRRKFLDRRYFMPSPNLPDALQRYFNRDFQNRIPVQPLNPDNEKFEKMEEQMKQMQERLDKLENQQKQDLPDEKSGGQEPEAQKTTNEQSA